MNGTNDRSGNPVKGQRPGTLYPQVSGSSRHGKPTSFLEQSLIIPAPQDWEAWHCFTVAMTLRTSLTFALTHRCSLLGLLLSWLLGPET